MLMQVVASGIMAGSVYALIAVGFVLIFKGTRVVHFGQGEQVMLGAYLVVVCYAIWQWPLLLAIGASIVVSGLVGLGLERVLRPLMARPPLTKIIATLAVGLILREGTRAVMGPNAYPFPFLLPPSVVEFAGILIGLDSLGVIVISTAIMAALYIFFQYTRFGTAVRAACENRTAAALVGVSVPLVFSSIWVLSSMLAAVAGILLAPIIIVTPDMGGIALRAWVAAVVGGFTSLPGAVAGGLLLGIMETAAGAYISTALKDGVTYLVLIGILLIKPTGLFERQRVKKV